MRLPPIAPEALDTEQRRLYDDMKAGVASKYDAFVTVREDGALLGPWGAWLYQPELGTTLAAGERPGDLSEQEAAGYDVAAALINGGVLPEPTYRQALALFGQRGIAELIYLVGHYCFVSTTLNGFAIGVPDNAAANLHMCSRQRVTAMCAFLPYRDRSL
jgi:4-carboxymuconolactone decarboxylase